MREGQRFGTVIAQAGLSFSSTGAMSDAIMAAAHELLRAAGAAMPQPQQITSLAAFFEHRIWPNYTMATERQIHGAVLAGCGLSTASPARAPETTGDEADAFLF